MSAKKQAKFLSENFGFNVIPMMTLTRDDEGNKIACFEIGYARYRTERYDLEDWPKKSEGLAIVTGEISNLTIVDIDSKEALKALEDTTNLALEDMANYIVKTTKGYQLFYSYEKGIKSEDGFQTHLDLLNDGKQTFADPVNSGYSYLKKDSPGSIPEPLLNLFKQERTKLTKQFLTAVHEESTLTYKNPLHFLLEDYLSAKRLTSNILKPLERRFCSGDYKGHTFDDFKRRGNRTSFRKQVSLICASDPTVSQELYYKFLTSFAEKVVKTSKAKETTDRLWDWSFDNVWDYNPKWRERYEKVGTVKAVTSQAEIKVWYNPSEDRYMLYDLKTKHVDKYSAPAFKVAYKRATKQSIELENVEAMYTAFAPYIDDMFFKGSDSRFFYNSFKRTPLMELFLTTEPETLMPSFIGAVLDNVFPLKEHKELFLHNLAFHLKYLNHGNTLIMSLGKAQGTGKNLLYDHILKEIYGKYHLTWDSHHFTDSFNGSLDEKLIVHGNDIKEKVTATSTKTLGNVVKTIVANPTISITAKGKETKEVENYTMWFMSSNADKPFTIDEGENRRLNVFPTSKTKLEEAYPETPSSQDGIRRLLEKELPSFIAYLASLPLDPSTFKSTIKTPQVDIMVGKSTSTSHKIAQAMMDKDLEVLEEECEETFLSFYRHEIVELGISYVTAAKLKEFLPQQRKQVTDYFKANGVEFGIQNIPRERKSGLLYVINPEGTKQEELISNRGVKYEKS